MKTLLLLLAAAAACLAGETRSWLQADAPSFQKGNLKGLAVRSDGRLSLAPKTTEIYDSSTAYLWAMVRDSEGNTYTGGGPGAKLFRIASDGTGSKLAEFDALEIHALAVDSKDRLYVATAPDGKVYRVDDRGVSTEFYAPGQKYIWAMATDAADNLYIATGDKGEVHRVTPDGKGAVFFRTDETHARSLAFDRDGNLIVGTEPGGLVIRVSKTGDSFVVYQMAKKEVTALVVGPNNDIYAAAVGTKTAPVSSAPPAAPAPAAPPATSGTIVMVPLNPPAPPAPPPVLAAGGSEVYRIPAKSSPEKLWGGTQDFVYALALDPSGHLLIGSGNKGTLYRVESRVLYTTLTNFPVAQITSLATARDGSVYAATGNVGKVFRVGPGLEAEGSIESDVFDTGGFSTFGYVTPGTDLHGGTLSLTARSGNLDRPQKNWSPWSKPVVVADRAGTDGGRVDIPPARFVQWKATLTGPVTLDSVATAYLRENIAPHIDIIEATNANYRFPAPSLPLTLSSPLTLSLPALGATPAARNPDATTNYVTPSMTYAKGWQGVRWSAGDDNGDTLIFKLEIRGEKETSWKPLRDKISERYYSFDSTAYPDGDYRIRVTASDSPSNTPENALSATEESDPFTIDNTPPRIAGLKATSGTINWHAADELSTIRRAEYSLDGGDWTFVEPSAKLSDAKALDYSIALKLAAGEHTVAVRVTDDADNVAVEKVVVR